MDKPTSPESSRNLDPFQEIERQLQIKIKKSQLRVCMEIKKSFLSCGMIQVNFNLNLTLHTTNLKMKSGKATKKSKAHTVRAPKYLLIDF